MIAVISGVAMIAALLVFGVIGIGRTVGAGSEAQVCGTRVGVAASSDGSVRLLGTETGALSVGDRSRIGAFCVVEVVDINASAPAAPNASTDGGGASVQLRWRLW
ncbi:hypothetical protein SD72_12420 [Leucobacter komagatae]|uniref:Uncharacterized protein n=2 Tax=Leucobacter komagatae TaxID=55969 RepID=A0A0D0IJY0_9MICO|nr:hypothetical protein SD72_12420 [Leucobacter komagatae]